MTRECITHHYACDCREELHRQELAAKDAEIARLSEIAAGANDGGHWYSQQTMDAVSAERDKLREDSTMLDWIETHGDTIMLDRSARYVAIAADRESIRRVMRETK